MRFSTCTKTSLALFLLIGAAGLIFFKSNLSTDLPGAAVLQPEEPPPLPMGFKLPTVPHKAFAAGEKLDYSIIYKGITVGNATIEITDGPLVNNRPTLKYISKAKSTSFFDMFFKVRDENVSTVDKASLYSVSFDQNLHEGRYKAVRHYHFDYLKKKYTSMVTRKGKTKKNEGTLEEPLFDVLSALYYTRTQPLTPGRDVQVSIYRDGSSKKIPIRIGEAKKIETPLGTFSCLRVEPYIQGDSIFKSKDGSLVVWMTNDERRLPVFMEATASVGVVRVKLTNWKK